MFYVVGGFEEFEKLGPETKFVYPRIATSTRVCVCVCLHVHVYMHIYIYIDIYMYTSTYVCVHVRVEGHLVELVVRGGQLFCLAFWRRCHARIPAV